MIAGNIAVAGGGGVSYCDGTVTACTISGNTAGGNGGGIRRCDGEILNCTIVGNSAPDGGGLFDCIATIANCIVWENTLIQVLLSTTPTFSCIEGGGSGAGSIAIDPAFVLSGYWNDNGTPSDPADDFWVEGDYHLLPNSPCIDTGSDAMAVLFTDTTTAVGTQATIIVADASFYAIDDEIEYDNDGILRTVTVIDIPTNTITFAPLLLSPSLEHVSVNNYGQGDLDGEPRILGCVADMGADEFTTGQPGSGDLDGNGILDLPDLPLFIEALLDSPNQAYTCVADVNEDGSTNGLDVEVFIDWALGP